ncbi:hypothetical protein Agub_g9031, partial [Astrephomene gubernaculifera]
IDEACGGRPALLTRADLHLALASSAALAAAGLGPHSPDPPGGKLDRHPGSDRPTGLLRETAMRPVLAAVPPPSAAALTAALAAAARTALTRGVTTVGDMGRYLGGDDPAAPWGDLQGVLLPAADAGRLPLRVVSYMPLRSWRRLASWRAAQGGAAAHPSGRLFWGGLKDFA